MKQWANREEQIEGLKFPVLENAGSKN